MHSADQTHEHQGLLIASRSFRFEHAPHVQRSELDGCALLSILHCLSASNTVFCSRVQIVRLVFCSRVQIVRQVPSVQDQAQPTQHFFL